VDEGSGFQVSRDELAKRLAYWYEDDEPSPEEYLNSYNFKNIRNLFNSVAAAITPAISKLPTPNPYLTSIAPIMQPTGERSHRNAKQKAGTVPMNRVLRITQTLTVWHASVTVAR
jgi:hypothetical protein